ncbi:unnamed protein product, partial [Prorocentrum cordatum]
DPTARLTVNLTRLKAAPIFDLPLGWAARIAPELHAQTFCKHGGMGRAFEGANSLADWKQPRGAAASKWKSWKPKVRRGLANELGQRSIMDGEEPSEKDLTQRLRQKAPHQ